MKPEDFPTFTYNGVELFVMPELPEEGADQNYHRCVGCYAFHGSMEDRPDCEPLRRKATRQGYDCDPARYDCDPDNDEDPDARPVVYVSREKFQEYVVELVRRRVSG